MDHELLVSGESQTAVQALTQALEAQGLRVYRSFDLRSALVALPDCGCPHHATDQCNCQYAVLWVYGNAPSPAQVVAHGRDGQTWLSVLEADPSSAALQRRIMEILAKTFSQKPTLVDESPPLEIPAESRTTHSPSNGCAVDGSPSTL